MWSSIWCVLQLFKDKYFHGQMNPKVIVQKENTVFIQTINFTSIILPWFINRDKCCVHREENYHSMIQVIDYYLNFNDTLQHINIYIFDWYFGLLSIYTRINKAFTGQKLASQQLLCLKPCNDVFWIKNIARVIKT